MAAGWQGFSGLAQCLDFRHLVGGGSRKERLLNSSILLELNARAGGLSARSGAEG